MLRPDPTRLEPVTIEREGAFSIRAAVTPRFGANLVSLRVDGAELIHWDPKAFLAGDADLTGAFNMFPTPCRLANSRYAFDGRDIVQTKRGEPEPIHGLVRDEPFAFKAGRDRIVSSLTIDPNHPVYEGFPFSCVLAIEHALHETGLTVRFALENMDSRIIPFGYGIHPHWRIQGRREDVAVRIPCAHALDLQDLIPTGSVASVEGTALDLREWTGIGDLFIDNAFWKRAPGTTANVLFEAVGKRMVIEASDNFPHMIVYVPEGEPFFCVENLTTCPNAPNLATAGHGELANMLVAAPGQVVEGWIKYTFMERDLDGRRHAEKGPLPCRENENEADR
jgi:aldose 1-epimerase